jgi:hypothetical protein
MYTLYNTTRPIVYTPSTSIINMELNRTPDTYVPSVNEQGEYVDVIPPFHTLQSGLICPCASRKDKKYDSHSAFVAHTKTKMHQKWLSVLNANKANYYVENIKLQETLQSQRLIIARLEKEVQQKGMTIDYLTQQLCKKNTPFCKTVDNLLEFDDNIHYS